MKHNNDDIIKHKVNHINLQSVLFFILSFFSHCFFLFFFFFFIISNKFSINVTFARSGSICIVIMQCYLSIVQRTCGTYILAIVYCTTYYLIFLKSTGFVCMVVFLGQVFFYLAWFNFTNN